MKDIKEVEATELFKLLFHKHSVPWHEAAYIAFVFFQGADDVRDQFACDLKNKEPLALDLLDEWKEYRNESAYLSREQIGQVCQFADRDGVELPLWQYGAQPPSRAQKYIRQLCISDEDIQKQWVKDREAFRPNKRVIRWMSSAKKRVSNDFPLPAGLGDYYVSMLLEYVTASRSTINRYAKRMFKEAGRGQKRKMDEKEARALWASLSRHTQSSKRGTLKK